MRKEYDGDCWVSPDANYHNVIASLSLGGIARCNLVFFYSILGPTNSSKCSNRSGVRQKYKKKNFLNLPLNQERVCKMFQFVHVFHKLFLLKSACIAFSFFLVEQCYWYSKDFFNNIFIFCLLVSYNYVLHKKIINDSHK